VPEDVQSVEDLSTLEVPRRQNTGRRRWSVYVGRSRSTDNKGRLRLSSSASQMKALKS